MSSSSTESSEWNLSPSSRPKHNLPEPSESSKKKSPEPVYLDRPATSLPTTPQLGTFPSSAIPSSIRPTIPASEPAKSTADPPPLATASTTRKPPSLAIPSSSFNHPKSPAEANQSEEALAAARKSLLDQMTTFDDFIPPNPPARSTRGGAKRRSGGPGSRGGTTRRPKIKIEPASGDSVPTLATTEPAATRGRTVNRGGRPRGSRAGATSGRSVNRGGRPRGSRTGLLAATARRGVKRKRKRKDEDEDESDDTDASEEINLPTLTSSGRRITQASNSFFSPTPNVIDLEESAAPTSSHKKHRGSNGTGSASARVNNATPTGGSTQLKSALVDKERRKKRQSAVGSASAVQAAVCKNCGRGHSPQSNQIVFCDTCNTPWHQYCHDRPITPSVVQIEDKEWHCADCETSVNVEKAMRGRVGLQELGMLEGTGEDRGLKWQREYFLGLSKDVLVDLLLGLVKEGEGESRVFEVPKNVPVTAAPPAAAVGNAVERLEQAAENVADGGGLVAVVDDEVYEREEVLPYPKMGNGLALPPEDEDLSFLVDDAVGTLSHSWQENGGWRGKLAEQGFASGRTGLGISMGGMGRGGIAIGVGA